MIIDLRENRGGNMYPMLAGLSSLLPEGDLFSFAYRSGQKQVLSLKQIGSWSGLPLVEKKTGPACRYLD